MGVRVHKARDHAQLPAIDHVLEIFIRVLCGYFFVGADFGYSAIMRHYDAVVFQDGQILALLQTEVRLFSGRDRNELLYVFQQ